MNNDLLNITSIKWTVIQRKREKSYWKISFHNEFEKDFSFWNFHNYILWFCTQNFSDKSFQWICFLQPKWMFYPISSPFLMCARISWFPDPVLWKACMIIDHKTKWQTMTKFYSRNSDAIYYEQSASKCYTSNCEEQKKKGKNH